MKERKKQRDVGSERRGRTGDWVVVGNILMWVASDATWDYGGEGRSWSVLPSGPHLGSCPQESVATKG